MLTLFKFSIKYNFSLLFFKKMSSANLIRTRTISISQQYEVRFNHNMLINSMGNWFHFLLQEAIAALNGLQSNSSLLEKLRNSRKDRNSENLLLTKKYLERIEIPIPSLNKLNIIHIAG